jgi:hypothetical protein
VESFNGRLRQECLNANWFLSLEDAKAKIQVAFSDAGFRLALRAMAPSCAPAHWRYVVGFLYDRGQTGRLALPPTIL